MNSTISKKDKEILSNLAWGVINHLYESNGGGNYIAINEGVMVPPGDDIDNWEGTLVCGDELKGADILTRQGKYVLAEKLYKAGIGRYKKCRNSLDDDEQKLRDILGNSDVDLEEVLGVARSEIDQVIKVAENNYRFVREQRAKGIDEVSSEQRYKEIVHDLKRRKKYYIAQSVVIILLTVLVKVLVDEFSFPSWISTALIILCATYVFSLFFIYYTGVEYTFKGMEDPDILEGANRDGYYGNDFVIGSAFSEGKLAFSQKVDLNANPYTGKNHKNAEKWNAGWEEASRKRKDFESDYSKRKRK